MTLRGRHNSTDTLVETASFLVVRLGGCYLAFPAAGVRGVLANEEAGHSEAVTAMGSVYPPIDLAQRLSVVADLSGSGMRTVLYSNGRLQGAIRVEQVVGLTDVERKDCFPLPAQFRCDEQHWFMGMMVYRDHLALVLNPSWTLGESDGAMPEPVGQMGQPTEITETAVGGSC